MFWRILQKKLQDGFKIYFGIVGCKIISPPISAEPISFEINNTKIFLSVDTLVMSGENWNMISCGLPTIEYLAHRKYIVLNDITCLETPCFNCFCRTPRFSPYFYLLSRWKRYSSLLLLRLETCWVGRQG